MSENKAQRRIGVIELSSAEPLNTEAVVNDDNYVSYGENNDVYDELIRLYQTSPTNMRCIRGISERIYGRGWTIVDGDDAQNAQREEIVSDDDIRRAVNDQKMLGAFAYRGLKSLDGKSVAKYTHWPMNTLRPGKANTAGKIDTWYYCANWSKVGETGYEVKPFKAMGHEGDALEFMAVFQPYVPGHFYFSPVDYSGALQYADLEGEISNYHLANIKNGLFPGMIINLNNGVPESDSEKREIEGVIKQKFGGTGRAGRVVVQFNESADEATTIEQAPISDADKQYQFLSTESGQKILTAHGITSPALLGINTDNGFTNNADEIATAEHQLMQITVRPLQDFHSQGLEACLAKAGLEVQGVFESLENTEKEEEAQPAAAEPTPATQMSADPLGAFIALGEDIDLNEWDEVEAAPVDYEKDDELNAQFVKRGNVYFSTGTARPGAKSAQDGKNTAGDVYLVRYRYVGNMPERGFCRSMLSAKKVYRKEDILQLSGKAVNPGFGPNGENTYSIWEFKGGPRCSHYWERVIFKGKDGVKPDPKSPNAKKVSTSQARREGFRPEANAPRVAVKPRNMKNKGFLNPPSNKDRQPGI